MRTKLVIAGLVAVALAGAGGAAFANERTSQQERSAGDRAGSDRPLERTPCDPAAAGSALSKSDGVGGEADAAQVVTSRLLELGNEACFAGFVVDQAADRITSYWKGAVPGAAQAYAESKPEGLQVVIDLDARYSRAELRDAASRLHEADVFDAVRGVSVGVASDGGGLKLWVKGATPPSETQLREISKVTGVAETDLNIITSAGDIDTSVPKRIDQPSDIDTTIPQRIE